MASNMDVDTPKSHNSDEDRITIHPLAIVKMSDQYTRITCGGTPLRPTDAVTGLLLGTLTTASSSSSSHHHYNIWDAEDIPLHDSSTQVSLHQAVFPTHQVLGWYRVSALDEEPTAHDWQQTHQLATSAVAQASGGGMPFYFALMEVPRHAREELPLTLYRLKESSLEAVEEWSLKTAEAERIAVERVIREQPQRAQQNNNNTNRPTSKDSAYIHSINELQVSLQAIHDRMAILVAFLQDTQNHSLPFDPALMRKVQSVLMQMGPLMAAQQQEQQQSHHLDEDNVFQQLAYLAKTVQEVQSYTEKSRIIADAAAVPRTVTREGRDTRSRY